MVFIVRGSLYLAAVSSRGEPAAVLRRQLAVLYSQILCILTNGFERMFARNPRFDSRRLLGTALLTLPHNPHATATDSQERQQT